MTEDYANSKQGPMHGLMTELMIGDNSSSSQRIFGENKGNLIKGENGVDSNRA
jgi:hypothetical protein